MIRSGAWLRARGDLAGDDLGGGDLGGDDLGGDDLGVGDWGARHTRYIHDRGALRTQV